MTEFWDFRDRMNRLLIVQLLDVRLESLEVKDTKFALARLVGCEIVKSRFVGINLRQSRIERCSFEQSLFVDTDLSHSIIIASSFKFCSLSSCSFTGAKVSGCDFSHSVLGHDNFVDATLERCSFKGALSHGVDFRFRSEMDCNFTQTLYDAQTSWNPTTAIGDEDLYNIDRAFEMLQRQVKDDG